MSSMGYGAILQGLGIGFQTGAQGVIDTDSAEMQSQLAKDQLQYANALKQLADEFGIEIDPNDLILAFQNPNIGNPALAGATFDAMAQMGLPTAGVLGAGGPLQAAVNAAGTLGLTRGEFMEAIQGLKKGKKTDAARAAARAAGYTSLNELRAAQTKWESQTADLEKKYEAIRGEVVAGRMSAMQGIAALQKDFPIPTAQGLADLEQRAADQMYANIERNRADEQDEILQAANTYGFNPAAAIGRMSEASNLARYNVNKTDALERAVELMGGQQGLARTAIGTLSGSLNEPAQLLGNLAATRSQGSAVSGNIAVQQALANNAILAEAEFTNALTKLGLEIGGLQAGLGSQATRALAEWIKDTRVARGASMAAQGMIGMGGSMGTPSNSGAPATTQPLNMGETLNRGSNMGYW